MKIRLLTFVLAAGVALAGATYTYDGAGRLTKVDYGSGGSITYTYDKAGNLLSRTVQGASPSSAPASTAKKPAAKKSK